MDMEICSYGYGRPLNLTYGRLLLMGGSSGQNCY
jgi:hypothetical protein